MNMKKIVLAVAMISGMGIGAAHADSGHGKIKFEGTIVDAACSIDAKSIDQTIQMGALSKAHLDSGGKSTPVDFSIKLHDCDINTANTAAVSFNGLEGDAAEGLDKALAISGQAKGVGVVITDVGSNVISPNTLSPYMTINNGDNELMFQAYVQGGSTAGAVTEGAFASVANFVMDYK